MHQHTTGFVILPCLIASQILYSSVPPICRRQRQMERTANRYAFQHAGISVRRVIPHLSQHNNHLHSGSVLVAQHVVSEHGARVPENKRNDTITHQVKPACLPNADNESDIPVPADGHTFENTVCGAGDYVVEFVGHAARAGHVGHAAWTIQLGGEDVIQHAASISDFETAWLDPSHLDERNRK